MNDRYIPVEGNPSLVRDSKSGAIINIDKNEIALARLRKQKKKQKDEKLENLELQVNKLNNDISDIKELLTRLVQQ